VAEKSSTGAAITPAGRSASVDASSANGLVEKDSTGAGAAGRRVFPLSNVSSGGAASAAHVLLLCANAHNINVNMQGPFRSMDQSSFMTTDNVN